MGHRSQVSSVLHTPLYKHAFVFIAHRVHSASILLLVDLHQMVYKARTRIIVQTCTYYMCVWATLAKGQNAFHSCNIILYVHIWFRLYSGVNTVLTGDYNIIRKKQLSILRFPKPNPIGRALRARPRPTGGRRVRGGSCPSREPRGPAAPGEDRIPSPDQRSFHTSSTPTNRGRKRLSSESIPPRTVWKP